MSSDLPKEIMNDDIVISPGACFGWFSPVATKCHNSTCLRSEWCRQYTTNRSNQEEVNSMKLDMDELGQETQLRSETTKEKKAKNKNMIALGKQAFFDKVVNTAASLIKYDSIKYNPSRTTASLKIGGSVIAFFARKRNNIIFEIGGRNKGGPVIEIDISDDGGVTIKDTIQSFIKKYS